MKKILLNTIVILFTLSLITSCEVSIQEIEYGRDQCNFCKMNIVDKTHAAQFVTKKGKQHKFDAIECMVNSLIEHGDKERAITVVSNYNNPGTLIDIQTSTFLISKKIKSPMGANLSAFSTKKEAIDILNGDKGKTYTWDELFNLFSKQ